MMGERSTDPAGTPGLCDRIEVLASRVERLSLSHRDPEAFFEERSEIAHALRREAARAARGGA